MQTRTLTRTLAAFAALVLTLPLSATEQGRDIVTYAGKRLSMFERPLNDYLDRLPEFPRFDIPNTANYKGYTAEWEVKNSRLYLSSFSATTNQKPFSIASLFPDRKLPIHANWYSGTVNILSGKETLAKGYYTYERVTALRVTNGVVIATKELRNVKENKLR